MKGTLRVIQTKNGIKSRIDFTLEETGKYQSVFLGESDYDLSLNGKDCEFDVDDQGNLKCIRIQGELIAMKLKIRHDTDPRRFGHTRIRHGREATAPYNFVPFPDPTEFIEVDERPDFSRFQEGRYSGKIFVTLVPKTPIFIRDTDRPTAFFSVKNGSPVIPGSSIRGLVRSMVEIISWSRPLAVNDIRISCDRTLCEIAGLDTPPVDFARNLFGFVNDTGDAQSAGRIYFEDGRLTDDADFEVKDLYTQILGGPKPTTFQHYLTQSSDDKDRLTHYNDNNARLRGFKLYWHRQQQMPPKLGAPANVKVDFTPVAFKRGGFESAIRFINLTAAEVGALLFVLNLPEGLMHHIGMAKPLGFGSVQTAATVSVIDPGVRYASFTAGLVDEAGFQDKDAAFFISEFEKWIITKLRDKNPKLELTTLWDHDRMNELAVMLQAPSADDPEWDNQRRYLTIKGHGGNEYRDRKVLPLPSQVDA